MKNKNSALLIALAMGACAWSGTAQEAPREPGLPDAPPPRRQRGPERPEADAPQARRGQRPTPPPIIGALDRDRNGILSEQELDGAGEALRQLDRNKDGQLGPEEFVPGMDADRGERPGRGPRPEGDRPGPGRGPGPGYGGGSVDGPRGEIPPGGRHPEFGGRPGGGPGGGPAAGPGPGFGRGQGFGARGMGPGPGPGMGPMHACPFCGKGGPSMGGPGMHMRRGLRAQGAPPEGRIERPHRPQAGAPGRGPRHERMESRHLPPPPQPPMPHAERD